MPGKARTEKKLSRDKELDALGAVPEHILERQRVTTEEDNNALIHGLGLYVGGLVSFDKHGEPYLHINTGKGERNGPRVASDKAEERADNLRLKYPEIWGKRGKAKDISITEGIPIRTVQYYFKKYPAN